MILKVMNYSDFQSEFLILVMTCLRYEIGFDALEKVLARILSRITTFNAGLWLFT